MRGRPTPSKNVIFIFCYFKNVILKTVADRYILLHIITSTGNGLFRFVNVDDFEPPKEGFW